MRLRFGVFEADIAAGELRRQGALVRLRPQPFRVLAALLRQPGEVVSRDDLRAEVWNDGTYVDFEQGLNYCIKEIRAALGDSAEAPRFVETLPRRGYRFLAPVEAVDGVPEATLPTSVLPKRAPARRALWISAVAGVLACVAGLSARHDPGPSRWTRLTFRRGSIDSARFLPGGGVLVGAAFDGQASALYALEPGVPGARQLDVEGARLAGTTSAGEVAFLAQPVGARPLLARAPLQGGDARRKDVLASVSAADAYADGFAVAHFVPGEGTRLEFPVGRVLTRLIAPTRIRIAPDGRHVAVVDHPVPTEDGGLVVVFDRDGTLVARSSCFPSIDGVAWSPEGDVFFTASTTGSDTAVHVMRLDGGVRQVMPSSGRLILHDIDARGRALVERTQVRTEVRDGAGRDLAWHDGSVGVALSRDGSRLLLAEMGEAGGRAKAAYLRSTEGAPPVFVSHGLPTDLSEDGQTAVIVPPERDRIELHPAGAGAVRTVSFDGLGEVMWARLIGNDDALVLAARQASRLPRVFVGPVSGGRARPVTPEGRVSRPQLVTRDGLVLAGCGPQGTPCLYDSSGAPTRPVEGADGLQPLALLDGPALLVKPRGARYPTSVERLDVATGQRTPFAVVAPDDIVGADPLVSFVVSADRGTMAATFNRRLSELYLVDSLR